MFHFTQRWSFRIIHYPLLSPQRSIFTGRGPAYCQRCQGDRFSAHKRGRAGGNFLSRCAWWTFHSTGTGYCRRFWDRLLSQYSPHRWESHSWHAKLVRWTRWNIRYRAVKTDDYDCWLCGCRARKCPLAWTGDGTLATSWVRSAAPGADYQQHGRGSSHHRCSRCDYSSQLLGAAFTDPGSDWSTARYPFKESGTH